MKTLSYRFSVMMLWVALVHMAAIAGGFQLNEHGARALAQAGAWSARAYDGSAIFFNPAGLGFQKQGSVYLGTTIISPSISFYGPTNRSLSNKTEMVSQTFTPISAYATYPVTEDIHVGIGVNNPYGLGTEWPDKWDGKFITQKVDLKTFFISPTVAYKINDKFSVGAGFNYVTGDVKLSRYVDTTFSPKVAIDLSGTGYGFNLGAIYKFNEQLSVGASYRSSVKIDATGSAKFEPSTITTLPSGDAAASLELPATAFIGVAYKVLPELEVEADYQFVGWSSYKELAVEFKKNNSKSVSPKNYEDTYILRVGCEYTMDGLQIRLGYLFDNTPVKDKYLDPLLPDADRNGVNIGVGYKITSNLFIDASYFFEKFAEHKVNGTEVNFDGTYQASANLFGISLGYNF